MTDLKQNEFQWPAWSFAKSPVTVGVFGLLVFLTFIYEPERRLRQLEKGVGIYRL